MIEWYAICWFPTIFNRIADLIFIKRNYLISSASQIVHSTKPAEPRRQSNKTESWNSQMDFINTVGVWHSNSFQFELFLSTNWVFIIKFLTSQQPKQWKASNSLKTRPPFDIGKLCNHWMNTERIQNELKKKKEFVFMQFNRLSHINLTSSSSPPPPSPPCWCWHL